MEVTGLYLGLIAQLIANVAATPAFNNRYPKATIWLNLVGASLNTANAVTAIVAYKAKAAVALVPDGNPRSKMHSSFVVSLAACILSFMAAFWVAIGHNGSIRAVAAIVFLTGIVGAVRIMLVLLADWSGPSVGPPTHHEMIVGVERN